VALPAFFYCCLLKLHLRSKSHYVTYLMCELQGLTVRGSGYLAVIELNLELLKAKEEKQSDYLMRC
jgi:hypothetical protein